MSATTLSRPAPTAPRFAPRRSHPARPELDTVASQWQAAFDTAGRALDADAAILQPAETAARRRRLSVERHESASLLREVARVRGIEPVPWLPAGTVTAPMVGLDRGVRGCIFDLEGVLTDSGRLHAAAWAAVFDDYLMRLAHETGRQFVPFDGNADYRTFLEGRLRIEGIHAFLASRGIRVAEGRPDDDARADTAYGFARHKGELLEHSLEEGRLAVLPGAHRYLLATGYAGLGRAVVSASSSTLPMLRLAALDHLVDARVDADAMRSERLRPRPAPDLLLAGCRKLGIEPGEAVAVTHSGPGIVAAGRAGLAAIGIAAGAQADILRDFGAARVVTSLSALLR